jgi:exocyst complex component 4
LAFLHRLKEVVPTSSEISSTALTMFLDEFLVNVFLPQMEETLSELCTQTISEGDAFQEDPLWPSFAQKPILRSTKKFADLVVAFCGMLDNLPHDQAFSQLLVTQMVTYHGTCQRWVSDLVARTQPKAGTGRLVKLSAALVKIPELRALTEVLSNGSGSTDGELREKETAIFLEQIGEEKLEEADLVVEGKSIAAMCLMYTSMKWLASKMNALRRITERTADSSRRHSGRPQPKRQWSAVDAAELKEEQISVYLPLTKDTAQAFDGAIAQFRFMADTTLETLHLEVRCHVVYHLQRSLQDSYMLEQNSSEPDSAMIDLNSDLAVFYEELGAVLPESQQA